MNEQIQEKVLIITALAMEVNAARKAKVFISLDGNVDCLTVYAHSADTEYVSGAIALPERLVDQMHWLETSTAEELDVTIEELEGLK